MSFLISILLQNIHCASSESIAILEMASCSIHSLPSYTVTLLLADSWRARFIIYFDEYCHLLGGKTFRSFIQVSIQHVAQFLSGGCLFSPGQAPWPSSPRNGRSRFCARRQGEEAPSRHSRHPMPYIISLFQAFVHIMIYRRCTTCNFIVRYIRAVCIFQILITTARRTYM